MNFKSFEFNNYRRTAPSICYKEYESPGNLLQDQIAVDEMEISIEAWRMSTGHYTSVVLLQRRLDIAQG
jgi:hypothetical protein